MSDDVNLQDYALSELVEKAERSAFIEGKGSQKVSMNLMSQTVKLIFNDEYPEYDGGIK